MAETAPLVSVEPQEREDPRNALLDMIETVAVNQDLVGPLFARLQRLLPSNEDEAGTERELEMSTVLTALGLAKPKSEASIRQIEAARAIVRRQLAAVRARRGQ